LCPLLCLLNQLLFSRQAQQVRPENFGLHLAELIPENDLSLPEVLVLRPDPIAGQVIESRIGVCTKKSGTGSKGAGDGLNFYFMVARTKGEGR
ncbi:MAG: hypothetical protein ACREJ0_06655, partial [Geminicoccaceae bacterium]